MHRILSRFLTSNGPLRLSALAVGSVLTLLLFSLTLWPPPVHAAATECTGELIAWISTSAPGITPDGLTFNPEDVMAYDPSCDEWSMAFDGSAYGLSGQNLDAIHVTRSEELFYSLGGSSDIWTVPLAGGTPTIYVTAEELRLTDPGEDIDGMSLWNHQLRLTTTGDWQVPGLSGDNDDVFAWDSIALEYVMIEDGIPNYHNLNAMWWNPHCEDGWGSFEDYQNDSLFGTVPPLLLPTDTGLGVDVDGLSLWLPPYPSELFAFGG